MKKFDDKQPKYHSKEKDSWDDRPRHRERAIQQNKDAQRIERALKRKDYKMLSEDLY